MQTIGLIAAMTQERDALLRWFKGWQRLAVGPLRGHGWVISGMTCLLVTSGMGLRQASQAARHLLEHSSPQLLISFGIAGAVNPDLEIGDVVLAQAVCRMEHGVIEALSPLAPWPEAAREAASLALAGRGRRLLSGTAVTTGGSPVMESQLGAMQHPVLEMETAGIAQVAAQAGIPLLSLRAISDGPRAPIPIDLGQVMDADANLRAGKLLREVIRDPGIILQSRRMLRNTRIAADNAALALVAALSQAGFG